MKSLVFFNNKGGVGKTTLACNMAAYIAEHTCKRVLVVDLDPQCNATQLLLEEATWDKLYGNKRDSIRKTIMKVLRPIRMGDSGIDTDLDIERSDRFGVDVLPGHPSLSMMEDRLSSSWGDFQGGDLGGARRTRWVSSLVDAVDYDLVIFDLGPSLGALNRTVLLSSEGFVTPMAADLFSLYALDNISEWIAAWTRDYNRAAQVINDREEDDVDSLQLPNSGAASAGWIGYTVQQYVTKAMHGTSRSVNAYERFRKQIPSRGETLVTMSYPGILDHNLGVVPNMFSMVPLAQAAHAPIKDLTFADGLRGAQVNQQQRYAERLNAIAQRLIENADLETE